MGANNVKEATAESPNKKPFSLINATVVVAIMSFIGTTVGTYLQGTQNIRLEREKLRSSLILKSLDFQESEDRIKYLKFIIDLTLIDDVDKEVLEKYYKEPDLIPSSNNSFQNNKLMDSSTHEKLKTLPDNFKPKHLNEIALKIAVEELGKEVIENSENSSPNIEKYLKPLNLKDVPWSAAFISYCYHAKGNNIPFKYSSSFLSIINELKVAKLIYTCSEKNYPQPGDMYFILIDGKPRMGGIVHHFNYPFIFGIEGNNSNRLQGLKRDITKKNSVYLYSKIR